MFEDGLRYQDSYMSSVSDFEDGLEPFIVSDINSSCKGGPVLYRDGDIAYIDSSDTHTLILGDTGSMKTLRFVLPLIYTCGMSGESMVTVDPKGELARKTTDFLKSQGYKTVVINLRHPQDSPDSWNPMELVEKAYEQGINGKQNATLLLNDLILV